jgi:hypothetical protein
VTGRGDLTQHSRRGTARHGDRSPENIAQNPPKASLASKNVRHARLSEASQLRIADLRRWSCAVAHQGQPQPLRRLRPLQTSLQPVRRVRFHQSKYARTGSRADLHRANSSGAVGGSLKSPTAPPNGCLSFSELTPISGASRAIARAVPWDDAHRVKGNSPTGGDQDILDTAETPTRATASGGRPQRKSPRQ